MGNAYATGFTASTNFPTANALQPTLAGGADAFVSELSLRLPFSCFGCRLELHRDGEDFDLDATFTIGPGGNINPLTEVSPTHPQSLNRTHLRPYPAYAPGMVHKRRAGIIQPGHEGIIAAAAKRSLEGPGGRTARHSIHVDHAGNESIAFIIIAVLSFTSGLLLLSFRRILGHFLPLCFHRSAQAFEGEVR
jgi:hypothetical protein